jgi:hypothetical protein
MIEFFTPIFKFTPKKQCFLFSSIKDLDTRLSTFLKLFSKENL